MIPIWTLRVATSNILFNFFGYLSPALNSTKAIISKDEEGIREYLTYWCVFGLLLYVEFLLNMFAALRNWPPESKVFFILWLTLPQFQGAYRIYSFVLRPYFEKYEQEIDEQIKIISLEVSGKANRHMQNILWQLFLAPNDGLLAGALSTIARSKIANPFLSQKDLDLYLNVSPSQEQLQRGQGMNSSLSLRNELLKNFTEMLVDGIYADVRHDCSTCVSFPCMPNEMRVCRVGLADYGYNLKLTEQGTDEENYDIIEELSSDNNSFSPLIQESLIVPLLLVASVESENFDSKMVVIKMCNHPYSSSNMKKSVACASASASEIGSLCLQLDTEEEAEALSAGLSVLWSDVKKRGTRILHRAFQRMNNISRLNIEVEVEVAFKRWKKSSDAAREIDKAEQSYFQSK